MRKLLMLAALGAIVVSAPLAKAETPRPKPSDDQPCPELKPAPKPKKTSKKKPTNKSSAPVAAPVCPRKCVTCPQGPAGEKGPKGDKGDSGETKVVFVEVASPEPARLRLAAGMIGSAFAPEKSYAWAWGPALQLQYRSDARREITATAGFAGGFDGFNWSPGRTRAWLLEAAYTDWRWGRIGWTLGAHLQWIGAKPAWETGMYVGAVPGLAFQWEPGYVRFRLDLKPFLGVSSYQGNGESRFAIGATSALTVTWK